MHDVKKYIQVNLLWLTRMIILKNCFPLFGPPLVLWTVQSYFRSKDGSEQEYISIV